VDGWWATGRPGLSSLPRPPGTVTVPLRSPMAELVVGAFLSHHLPAFAFGEADHLPDLHAGPCPGRRSMGSAKTSSATRRAAS